MKYVLNEVPEDSVLVPLLCILQMNDLPSSIMHAQIILFADGAIVYCADKSSKRVFEHTNKDLDMLYD